MRDRSALRILVVDDDPDILDLLKYNFEKEGFKVKTLDKSYKAIETAREFQPDLIILDIMMPHFNGMELCEQLRSAKDFRDTYIFFLTGRSGSYYEQTALNIGGDDYIEKVVGLRSLIYKVSAVLKKHFIIRKSQKELKIGGMVLNREMHSVEFVGQCIKLNKAEFELLFFFAQNPDKVISRDALVNNIWGSEIYVFETNIESYIDNLRRKIKPGIIRSLQNERYQFVVS